MMEGFEQRLQMIMVQLPPFILAVVVHEFGHGWIASYWGDKTAKEQGRLTLNPIPHLDPIGTVLFPLINMISGINLLFGWARPVPIDPKRFRQYRPGLFWVSFAGPGMNFILAVVSAAVFCAIDKWVPQDFYLYEPLTAMAYVSVPVNFALGIFNLIPLPPLDGSKMVESFLSYNATKKYESIAQYSFYILLALMFTGAFRILSIPIEFFKNLTFWFMMNVFSFLP